MSQSEELLPEESSLMTLVELQKFLSEEISLIDKNAEVSKAFRPLTEGLGLKAREVLEELTATPPPMPQPKAKVVAAPPVIHTHIAEPTSLAEVLHQEKAIAIETAIPIETFEVPVEREEPVSRALPPPVPKPGFFRRVLAGIVDELFVFSVLGGVLGVASLLVPPEADTSMALLLEPASVRFVLMGFSALWMCYLVVGVGVLDMTFGMWAWGLRIGYHTESRDGRFSRKLLRILLSFFFLGLIVPSVLLLFRAKGRNLLDFLSGSYLYRTTG